MKITGQILKENRERKNITLSEVSLSTKITIKTLVAIEDGNPDNLPPKTFLRGFVRSYAQYLGLDVEEILRTFQEEMGSTVVRPHAGGTTPSEVNAEATESAADSVSGSSATRTSTKSSQKVSPSASLKTEPGLSQLGKSPDLLDRILGLFPKTISVPRDSQAALNNETSLTTKLIVGVAIAALVGLISFFKSKMDRYEDERISADTAAQTAAADPLVADAVDGSVPAPEQADEAAAGAQPIPAPALNAAAPLNSDPESSTSLAATPTPTPTPTATPTPTPKPTPTPTATPTPTPKPTPTPTATPTPTPKPTPTPTATPTPTPKPTPTPTATPTPTPKPTPTPTATPTPTPKPTATPTPATTGTKEILIEALDNVDIEAVIDGEPAKSIKLKPDQVKSLKIRRNAILKISDGGAVNLIVNGIDRGVPGDLGKPTKVELP